MKQDASYELAFPENVTRCDLEGQYRLRVTPAGLLV
jgi:hypothetical protein